MTDVYLTTMKAGAISQMQHRASNFMSILGMIVEPVIYLVVWSRVAKAGLNDEVAGFTPGMLAAYYITWTLVRNMTFVFTPYGFEQRIRTGEFSANLLRPVHPVHTDIAEFAGWKFAVIILWLPVAAVLSLLLHPVLHPTAVAVLVFLAAIWAAYVIRALFMWALGLITLWTTRGGAFFELYVTLELLLSGRLVPLQMMPRWAQQIAGVLPFQSTFGFPIDALVTPMTGEQLLIGLGTQFLWIGVGATLLAVIWKRAVRRYSAVSG
jgi:ABC-2 type transport system permease protein